MQVFRHRASSPSLVAVVVVVVPRGVATPLVRPNPSIERQASVCVCVSRLESERDSCRCHARTEHFFVRSFRTPKRREKKKKKKNRSATTGTTTTTTPEVVTLPVDHRTKRPPTDHDPTAPTGMSGWRLAVDDDDAEPSVRLYCLACRQRLSPPGASLPAALRCSRCRVVHYCSRECQRSDFRFHKRRCRTIQALRTAADEDAAARGDSSRNQALHDATASRCRLAHAIVDLAYLSTDSIEKGQRIYHSALVEYCRILEAGSCPDGVLESVLVLLSVLGLDDDLCRLVDRVLVRWEERASNPGDRGHGNDRDDVFRAIPIAAAAEPHPPVTAAAWFEPRAFNGLEERLQALDDAPWSANAILVPLLVVSLRRRVVEAAAEAALPPEGRHRRLEPSAVLGRAIESRTNGLPVLRALLPGSDQRWGTDEASELLGGRSSSGVEGTGGWTGCLVLWRILQDALALEPGMADALEATIDSMGRGAHAEVPVHPGNTTHRTQGLAAAALEALVPPTLGTPQTKP